MPTFNLPSQVCGQTFNPPRKFECKLAPPFACKCLHACPRAQICLQTFSPASRVFAQTFNPASQVCAQTFNLPAQVCIQTFNLVAQACMQTCSPASQVWITFKKNLQRKIITKMKKNVAKAPFATYHAAMTMRFTTIYDSQLQNKKVFRTQPQQRGTLTQPFHCDLQRLRCKAQ